MLHGTISGQLFGLFVLSIPVACIARTVVSEEVFREPREYCQRMSRQAPALWQRKLFYLVTCEYCFSHWVAIAVLAVTGFRLMYDDWRGVLVAWFSIVFVANCYLALYSRVRVDITSEKASAEVKQKESRLKDAELAGATAHAAAGAAGAPGRGASNPSPSAGGKGVGPSVA
jgi:hypothetical protein